MSVQDRLKNVKIEEKKPIWAGPCDPGPQGGVTYSLLCKFLNCRDRFKALVVHGYKTKDEWKSTFGFGNMWHCAEEAHAGEKDWEAPLRDHTQAMCAKYPFQQEEIVKWAEIAHTMFPIYIEHWKKHPDVKSRTPLLEEQVFDVPYKLPNGRVVRLRGKWDSVDYVHDAEMRGIWNQDNKTKSEIDTVKQERQLKFDLQDMIYITALRADAPDSRYRSWMDDKLSRIIKTSEIRGTRRNVIKRPRQYQGKKETVDDFHTRLEKIVREEPTEFFARWNTEMTERDIAFFKRTCLDPILMQLCLWYDVVVLGKKIKLDEVPAALLHYTHPYGVYDVLKEGGVGDLDSYVLTGSTIGLRRVKTLFEELET